jgi:HK97 family phage major capsid protein
MEENIMALSGTATNRTSIDLPVEVSQEILQKTQEASAIMQLARQIALPGRGTAINVITSDPSASWVGETEAKPVSDPGLATKVMRAYKLAVIVPFSNEFRRDVASLYDAIVERLPRALAQKFDATVFGNGSAPGSDFDTFANVTAQAIGADAYAGLVAADGDIAAHGGIMNGVVLAPQGKSILLGATDNDKRPLFINSVAEGAIPMVLGARTVQSKGAYVAGTSPAPNKVGIVGDWTQAMYGTVEGVKIDYSLDATLVDGNTTINLFQQNMFAVRAEIEVGFRADTSVFNALTDATT